MRAEAGWAGREKGGEVKDYDVLGLAGGGEGEEVEEGCKVVSRRYRRDM